MADTGEVHEHYDTLLARHYVWMAGGWDAGCEKSHRFFSDHAIRPSGSGIAIDLGAGCGFGSVALAQAGFRVTAIDFSLPMLDILHRYAGDLPIRMLHADILDFEAWAGEQPELITCLGDTLTHLPDLNAVRNLIRQCARRLPDGGTLIISCRNYSREPAGSSLVIQVERDELRIFLCRIDYEANRVRVEDILYTRESGQWMRTSGFYPKIRIAPDQLMGMLTDEKLTIRLREIRDGTITLIGQKRIAGKSGNG